MKFYRGCDVVPGPTGMVCRQSRLAGVVTLLVFSAIFAGLGIAGWRFGAPVLAWVIGVVSALIVLPILLVDVRACFRATNWVLWIEPQTVWVNLRSYRDTSAQDIDSVVELANEEIAEVNRRVERYTVPTSRGRQRHQKLESLELRLRREDDGSLAAVAKENRCRRQPERVHLGFIRGRTKLTHASVSLPSPDVIRIAWRGAQQHGVAPSLGRVLDALAGRFAIAESADEDRGDWRKLADGELERQVLQLVGMGNRIEAVQLLTQRCGYSMTKAHEFVEELERRV